ncbi:MAG: 50S ribosomal protein L23 [Candidatus Colwellbacteria bacterium]|nr:50S ribosomal protein L23 [Candidatus Colwellbacteria bacterium]
MPLNRLFIKAPIISEKATDLSAGHKYVFSVDARANKNEVKTLVEDIYKVHVTKVNITRIRNKSDKFKKAVVTLRENETINIGPQ